MNLLQNRRSGDRKWRLLLPGAPEAPQGRDEVALVKTLILHSSGSDEVPEQNSRWSLLCHANRRRESKLRTGSRRVLIPTPPVRPTVSSRVSPVDGGSANGRHGGEGSGPEHGHSPLRAGWRTQNQGPVLGQVGATGHTVHRLQH